MAAGADRGRGRLDARKGRKQGEEEGWLLDEIGMALRNGTKGIAKAGAVSQKWIGSEHPQERNPSWAATSDWRASRDTNAISRGISTRNSAQARCHRSAPLR
jgi:hypothetical protein